LSELPANYRIFGERLELLKTIRREVLGLGNDVVEDVRTHRIVYGRKTILRTFLDVRPARNGIAITIRRGRFYKDEKRLAVDRGLMAESILNSENLNDILELVKQSYLSV
jgi:predicted transport protein